MESLSPHRVLSTADDNRNGTVSESEIVLPPNVSLTGTDWANVALQSCWDSTAVDSYERQHRADFYASSASVTHIVSERTLALLGRKQCRASKGYRDKDAVSAFGIGVLKLMWFIQRHMHGYHQRQVQVERLD